MQQKQNLSFWRSEHWWNKKTKASQKPGISTRIIQENIGVFPEFFWKREIFSVANYRPVSILSTLSNFGNCVVAQMSTFFKNFFWIKNSVFYDAQYCLLIMLETLKRSADKGKIFGTLLHTLHSYSNS